jgi:protein-tyrosine-phosphatase
MSLFPGRKRQHLVIVCTANITRSPYIAHRLQAELESLNPPVRKLPQIASAGIYATPGLPAHPVLLTVMRMRGESLSGHLSQPFDDEVAKQADLVLTVEQSQTDTILKQFPSLAGRVAPLLAYGRDPGWIGDTDILDPTGGDVEDYQNFLDIADSQAQRLRRLFTREGVFPLP